MKVITIGRRVVPTEQIALVEAFDPAGNPEFKPEKDFKARVVLLNRDTVLTEETPQAFAEKHDLRLLAEDSVAVNRAVPFRVETVAPTESFKPSKPYVTRLKWRDNDGDEQSKLLITPPETVIAEILRPDAELPASSKRAPRRPSRTRGGSRKIEATRG